MIPLRKIRALAGNPKCVARMDQSLPQPASAPRRSSGGASFWWIYLALAALGLILLCTGLGTFAFTSYRGLQAEFQDNLSHDPTVQRELGPLRDAQFDFWRTAEEEGDEVFALDLRGAKGSAKAIVRSVTDANGDEVIVTGHLEFPDGRVVPLLEESDSSAPIQAGATMRWFDFLPGPATQEEIATVERAINTALPDDYRRYLATRQGRAPGDELFIYIPGSDYWNPIEVLHWPSSDLENPYRLSLDRDFVPAGYLLIGEDGSGNYYCLGITDAHRNQIIFVDHALSGEAGHIVKLAVSFQEFLDQLEEAPDDAGEGKLSL